MNEKKKATKSDKILNLVMVVVILAVLVVGVYATYGRLSENVKDKAIENGQAEATVEYLAKTAGMSVDDYLAQYGLSIGDTISAKTTESEMLDNMTLENYLLYNGGTQTADEVLEGTNLQDKATKDTLWKDFLPMVPAVSMLGGEDALNQIKEQFGLGDEVSDDISWGDLQSIIEETQAETENTEEAPAEEEAEEPEAE